MYTPSSAGGSGIQGLMPHEEGGQNLLGSSPIIKPRKGGKGSNTPPPPAPPPHTHAKTKNNVSLFSSTSGVLGHAQGRRCSLSYGAGAGRRQCARPHRACVDAHGGTVTGTAPNPLSRRANVMWGCPVRRCRGRKAPCRTHRPSSACVMRHKATALNIPPQPAGRGYFCPRSGGWLLPAQIPDCTRGGGGGKRLGGPAT